jgi:hypothetical protein
MKREFNDYMRLWPLLIDRVGPPVLVINAFAIGILIDSKSASKNIASAFFMEWKWRLKYPS